MHFYENYVQLCNKVGKKPTAVAVMVGIPRPTASRWARGTKPSYPNLVKLADYFGITVGELVGATPETAQNIAAYYNVSVDLLLGNADSAASETIETKKPATEVTGNEKRDAIISALEDLTPLEMDKLLSYIEGLIANRG